MGNHCPHDAHALLAGDKGQQLRTQGNQLIAQILDRIDRSRAQARQMEPDDAIAMSARILQEQLQYFINFEEPVIDDKTKEEESEIKFNRNLLRKVDELELSVRSANCLRNDNIVYIGDLVQKSENDMLRTPNFGRKSLNEIREVLMQMGLNLGMDITDWPPENIEELSKNLDDNL